MILNLFNTQPERNVFLEVQKVHVVYMGDVRVKVAGYEDPLFLRFQDGDEVLYDGETYSDFTCSELETIREFMDEVGGCVEPFDVSNTIEYQEGEIS